MGSDIKRDVHLVGSVPLKDSEAVFRAAASACGEQLRRIPDGETGTERSNWVVWQHGFLSRHPQLEVLPPPPGRYTPYPRVKLKAGVSGSDLKFENLGYAQMAKASYESFAKLKKEGVIPAGTKFQVSMPTPLAALIAWVDPGSQAEVEPAYERRMLAEVDEILKSVPAGELAIQWDVAVEIACLEKMPSHEVFWSNDDGEIYKGIIDRLTRIGNHVPEGVELGYHLCYGDFQHHHFKQPEDLSRLVSILNDVSAGVKRPLQWFHMPVPRDRTDEAYFLPLKNVKLHPETRLFIGLIHLTDGADGTRKRIATAEKVLASVQPNFGIACECGFGRRPPETVLDLFKVHAQLIGRA